VKRQKNIVNTRFAACTEAARLLIFLTEAARRAMAGRGLGNFNFSTGGHFHDGHAPLLRENILTRREIFRGKISRRNNQKTKTTSMKGRTRANTHE
jgi:hypothetical protein